MENTNLLRGSEIDPHPTQADYKLFTLILKGLHKITPDRLFFMNFVSSHSSPLLQTEMARIPLLCASVSLVMFLALILHIAQKS